MQANKNLPISDTTCTNLSTNHSSYRICDEFIKVDSSLGHLNITHAATETIVELIPTCGRQKVNNDYVPMLSKIVASLYK